jgi:hypothetical protein
MDTFVRNRFAMGDGEADLLLPEGERGIDRAHRDTEMIDGHVPRNRRDSPRRRRQGFRQLRDACAFRCHRLKHGPIRVRVQIALELRRAGMIGLIDDEEIRDLENSSLDRLHFVAHARH